MLVSKFYPPPLLPKKNIISYENCTVGIDFISYKIPVVSSLARDFGAQRRHTPEGVWGHTLPEMFKSRVSEMPYPAFSAGHFQ